MSGPFRIEMAAPANVAAFRSSRVAATLVAVSIVGVACGSATHTARPSPEATAPSPSSTQPANAPTTESPPEPSPTSETTPRTTDPDPTTTTTNDPVGAERCRRITDFDDNSADWVVVNDDVMGGRSNGIVDVDDSVMRFSGTVVTDGGGFTSVRHRLAGGEMAGTTRIVMRVRADGRGYGATLENNAEVEQRSVSHRADLDTSGAVDADGWAVATVEYTALEPSVFGRSVNSPAFDAGAAREIGIIIADGVDGDFSLDVDWIDVCD